MNISCHSFMISISRKISAIFLPFFQGLQLLIEPYIAAVTALRDLPFLHCLQHRTSFLLDMLTSNKTAAAKERRKLRKRLRQMLLQFPLQRLGVEGRKTRSVNNLCYFVQWEHLHMAGSMAAAAQRLADLTHRQVEMRSKGVK